MSFSCRPCGFADLRGWQDDDHQAAFAAFLLSANYHLYQRPYREREIKISQSRFTSICKEVIRLDKAKPVTAQMAKLFFEQHFTPHFIDNAEKPGFVTAYYEPEIKVSFTKTDRYRHPFYRQPTDLKSIKHLSVGKPAALKNIDFARQIDNGFEVYPDRKAIDCGLLDNQGLEIAYAANRADVYFTHIQGSAKLIDNHGKVLRISFAAKTGHPYTSIGRILIERGLIAKENISMDSIRAWMMENMEANSDQVDEILWQNQSYIFFSEIDHIGPVGAAKVPLKPKRSLAVDRRIHQFALPIFVSTRSEIAGSRNRLMIAHDTGSAIIGASRGDIFIGTGKSAGKIAGSVQCQAEFYILLPKI